MTITADRVREFIISDLGFPGDPEGLTDDYPLLENEVIDSLGIFNLVGFLEDVVGIEVDDEDLVPENFESISAIERFVDSKRGA